MQLVGCAVLKYVATDRLRTKSVSFSLTFGEQQQLLENFQFDTSIYTCKFEMYIQGNAESILILVNALSGGFIKDNTQLHQLILFSPSSFFFRLSCHCSLFYGHLYKIGLFHKRTNSSVFKCNMSHLVIFRLINHLFLGDFNKLMLIISAQFSIMVKHT